MKLNVKKSELILLIMDFLKNENLDKSLVSLENETGVHLFDYNREITFLRQLILDGHWTDAEEFLKPLKEHPKFEYNSSIFEIRKQKFLEAVEQEPEDRNNNVEELVNLLKDLQSKCSPSVFNQLMFCLSSPSITDHNEYKSWTPLSGRLKCFDKLRGYLEMIYPINKGEVKVTPGSFIKLINNMLVAGMNTSKGSKITSMNVSLLDEKLFKDINECQLLIEDDTKPRNKTPKDDNELLRKSNSAIKAMRNEKVSQSLKVNKISEIEDEDEANEGNLNLNLNDMPINNFNPNKVENYAKNVYSHNYNDFNKPNKNTPNNLNKNKNILYEIPEEDRHKTLPVLNDTEPNEIYDEDFNDKIPYSDHEAEADDDREADRYREVDREDRSHNIYEIDMQSEDQMTPNIDLENKLNKYKDHEEDYNNNALSDLDKEEYFMKSTYEYFDYDITTLTEKKIINDSHPIRASCFSPKGDYFAIGTNSKSIKLFEMKPLMQKFNKKNSYNFKNNASNTYDDIKLVFEQKNHHLGSIYCLDWSISGRLVASGSNDKLVKLMVIPDLEESYLAKDQETLELTIPGHRGTIRSVSFEPTSDLVLLSAGTIDTCIKVWDAEKGTNITNLEGHTNDVHTIKWSNDALICGSSGVDKTIRFWDLRDYKSTSLVSALKYSDINDISIHTRNKTISSTLVAAGHVDGMITIWDYNKRTMVKEIAEHSEEVRAVSFSPDGKYLASASFDSKIKIFDVDNSFDLIGELEHLDRVVSVKWHPEVPLLISTSADKTARIWIPDV